MIATGTRVTAKQQDGSLVSGNVVMSWAGGLMLAPDHHCRNLGCPNKPRPVTVKDANLVIRMKAMGM